MATRSYQAPFAGVVLAWMSAAAPCLAAADPANDAPAPDESYAIHGQATFVEQYHPAFASAYRGPNSLDPGSRGDETLDATLFGGVRPWQGAEIWVDAEIDQGFGLGDTLGVAAFPSAEAYKVGAQDPYVRVPRLFIRQTIGLGGESSKVEAQANQLGGSQTADRLVLTAGKFGVGDVFDTNMYAHDPRGDFLNWAVVDGGAFDYAADAWGYTYGLSAEWYRDWWTLRGAVFDGSTVPNSPFLDRKLGQQFQIVVEAEARYKLWSQPGAVRVLGFETRALLATLSDLTALYAADRSPDERQLVGLRHLHNKVGGEINLQQQLTDDLGAFMRLSFDDGHTEIYEFTDIDRSISAGLSLSGKRWGRPDDTVGLAGVVNNISEARKKFFEQGGLGVLIGDGRLTNAAPEQVIEAYYLFTVRKGVEVSADYQVIHHPAYNADRGPASVFGGRVHVQF